MKERCHHSSPKNKTGGGNIVFLYLLESHDTVSQFMLAHFVNYTRILIKHSNCGRIELRGQMIHRLEIAVQFVGETNLGGRRLPCTAVCSCWHCDCKIDFILRSTSREIRIHVFHQTANYKYVTYKNI